MNTSSRADLGGSASGATDAPRDLDRSLEDWIAQGGPSDVREWSEIAQLIQNLLRQRDRYRFEWEYTQIAAAKYLDRADAAAVTLTDVRRTIDLYGPGFFCCYACGHQHDEIFDELDISYFLRKALQSSEEQSISPSEASAGNSGLDEQ